MMTEREQEEHRQRKILLGFLASAFTIVGTIVPFMLTDQAGTIAWSVGILLAGFTLGLLNSRTPWKFPLLLTAGYTIAGVLLGGWDDMSTLLMRLQLGATLAIPAVIGSYAGAVVRKLVRGRLHWSGHDTPRVARMSALAIGAIASIIFIKVPGRAGVLYAALLLLAAALYLGYHYSDRLYRWVIMLGYGIPLAALMRTVLELYHYPEANGLFPIELSLALIVSVLPVLLGTMIGRAYYNHRLHTHY
ncbi:MAG: hypothetical protein IPG71_06515 [bacterium]|nr:hypothetical protein [bacterium]